MDYVKSLRKLVGNQPLILAGAVVLVINQNKELLLQHRTDGGWGLPGGLMELGEGLEDTARREVQEETGLLIGDLKLLGVASGPDYYFKFDNGDEIYSVTAIYASNDVKGEIKVDSSESIDVKFFKVGDFPQGITEEYKSYIFPYITDLID